MFKKALVAILAFAIVSMMFAPAFAWEYWWCGHDEKYEQWGPHVDQMLIKLYTSEISEWEVGLEGGEIDITDWPLDQVHLQKYTSPPWSDTLKVCDYGDECGLYMFDLNNNNNTYLGNPPNPAYLNPKWPNPMGYTVDQSGDLHDNNENGNNNGWWLRHVIAHLVNRAAVCNFVGIDVSTPVYTPLPPCYGKYSHPEIRPGGALEWLTHPYDPVEAAAILDASGIFPIGPDGWRYWDRNRNGVKDAGEDLVLKMISRVDSPPMEYMGNLLDQELLAQKIHVNHLHMTITAVRIQWNTNKDAHICTVAWRLSCCVPTSLINWHWNYYWHPGRCYNTAACTKDAFNEAADGVQYANTQEDAVFWARTAQEAFCEAVLSVTVFSYRGFKVMSKTYVGAEAGLSGQYWYGMVNWLGCHGLDNFYTFLNMHLSCSKWCQGTIRYGFKTVDIRQLNPLYTEWLWDNTVLDMIYGDSLVARNPYTMAYIPWVCKTFSIGMYVHPIWGTCTKVVFTLRNDIYFQDGTQLTATDIYYTFVELKKDLAARGLPPPWWISNVQDILSFSILDPLNFEVLLDVKSMFTIDWIGGNRILPKHIWKPIVTGAIAPRSHVAYDPMTFAPDPNLIGSGPWRMAEYLEGSHVLLVANKPSRTVNTGLDDPNALSVPIHNPKGYFRLKPMYVDTHADNYLAKILCKESVPACNPQKWMLVNLTANHNLWMEQFNFTFLGDPTHPVGGEFIMERTGCIWQIVNWIDGNEPEYPPNGILDVCDLIQLVPVAPPGPPGASIWVHIEWIVFPGPPIVYHVGQTIEADKYVYVDGNLLVGPVHEYEKPCDPIVETFTVNLTKCFHNVTLAKYLTTQWYLTLDNTLVPYPYDPWINVTWPIWVTIKEDIVGSYYINTQLLAPDCKVDLKDVFAAGKAFGSGPGDFKWNPYADINGDYKIDLKDYFAICKKFGKW